MRVGIACSLLGLVVDFTTSEELLSVATLIEDHTETGSHVAHFVFVGVVNVLSGVLASVPVDVLDHVLGIWLTLVHLWMILWLLDSSDPRLNCHELFHF